MIGKSAMGCHYWARRLGITFAEYHLMTTGEIEDLVLCNSIASGAMKETQECESIPDLR